MKDFICELLKQKGLSEKFWNDPHATVVVKPPVPKALSISRIGNHITITEAHFSIFGWFKTTDSEDIEMQFLVEDGNWTPLYLQKGNGKPRFSFTSDDGAFSPKPIVVKRQWAFARRWAETLIVKGLLRGIVEGSDF